MLKIITLFSLLVGLTFVIAEPLEETLTKSYFFLNRYNQLSYKLLHTINGIIAYSVETSSTGEPAPQYILLDYKAGYVKPILSDLMSSCNHTGPVAFDRLYYHAQTSTLAYYCTANNSLLVLDEQNYAVQTTIPTQLNETFAEAKLSADGNALYILAMGSLYTSTQVSQLVKIDLFSREVLSTVVFNKGLADGEVVNGFLTGVQSLYSDKQTYILTNSLNNNSMATVNIYKVDFEGGTYELSLLTNFSYHAFPFSKVENRPVPQLHAFGDYIVTNNGSYLIFYDTQGELVDRVFPITSKSVMLSQPTPYFSAFIAQEGSTDLYALTMEEKIVKFSLDGSLIITQEIGSAADLHIAYGNNYTNDLILTISPDGSNFTIADLQTSELLYTSITDYCGASPDKRVNSLMMTDSTYAVISDYAFYILDLQSNSVIANISQNWVSYLHQDDGYLYYIEFGEICTLNRLDLKTALSKVIYAYSSLQRCYGALIDLKISDSGFPNHVIDIDDAFYVIISEKFGEISFGVSDKESIIVPDYDTGFLYHLEDLYPTNTTQVNYYDYSSSAGPILKGSYNISNISVIYYVSIGNQQAVVISEDPLFAVIDLPLGTMTKYAFPTSTFLTSVLYDTAHRKHLIFSDKRLPQYWNGKFTPPSLFMSGEVSQVPGSNEFTIQAGSAELCSYWVADGYVSSVILVKFYNVCPGKDISVIDE